MSGSPGGRTQRARADYPHFETVYPATMERVAQLLEPDAVSEEDARRILFDNAAEVYGFDRSARKPSVERVGFERGEAMPQP